MPDNNNDKQAETYLVGKRDFNSFFVTICRSGLEPERREGFRSAEQARAWIRERVGNNAHKLQGASPQLS